MQENQSGVQGVLTLSYNSHQKNNIIVSSAEQLIPDGRHSVVLLEYNQEKDYAGEDYKGKNGERYSIDVDKLVSLIKENGTKIQ